MLICPQTTTMCDYCNQYGRQLKSTEQWCNCKRGIFNKQRAELDEQIVRGSCDIEFGSDKYCNTIYIMLERIEADMSYKDVHVPFCHYFDSYDAIEIDNLEMFEHLPFDIT